MSSERSKNIKHEFVTTSHFHVKNVKPEDRFGVWKESISCIFDVEQYKEERFDPFYAEVKAHMLGNVVIARTTSTRQKWSRKSVNIARDGMDHYMIQFFDQGATRLNKTNGYVESQKNSLIIFDLSQESESVTNDFSNLSLILPRAAISELIGQPDDQHRRVLSYENPLVNVLSDYMHSLERNIDSLDLVHGVNVGESISGLAAACMQSSADTSDLTAHSVERAKTALIREYIEKNLNRPDLGPNILMKEFGVSRTKLYVMFERLGGVASYIRERRLQKALVVLTSPQHSHRRLIEIALILGFSDDVSFNKAFKRRFGFAPGETRKLMLDEGQNMVEHTNLDRRYERWINRLSL